MLDLLSEYCRYNREREREGEGEGERNKLVGCDNIF